MVFDVTKLKGADISTEFCGVKLQSPFVLSSGPLSYAAEGLIRAHQAGAGAVVTKTIRLSAAINPVNHIAKINGDSLINCEKWADSKAEVWFEREIPLAKAAGAATGDARFLRARGDRQRRPHPARSGSIGKRL